MNDSIIYILLPLAFMLMFWGLRRTMGSEKQKKFIKINPLKGKTYESIAKAVGPPNIILLNNYTWTSGHYQITLSFDDKEICTGVVSEIYLEF